MSNPKTINSLIISIEGGGAINMNVKVNYNKFI